MAALGLRQAAVTHSMPAYPEKARQSQYPAHLSPSTPCTPGPSGYLLDCNWNAYISRSLHEGDMNNGERDTTHWAHRPHRPRLHIARRAHPELADHLTGFAICHADNHIRPEENLVSSERSSTTARPKTLSTRHSERRASPAQKIHLLREEKDHHRPTLHDLQWCPTVPRQTMQFGRPLSRQPNP